MSDDAKPREPEWIARLSQDGRGCREQAQQAQRHVRSRERRSLRQLVVVHMRLVRRGARAALTAEERGAGVSGLRRGRRANFVTTSRHAASLASPMYVRTAWPLCTVNITRKLCFSALALVSS